MGKAIDEEAFGQDVHEGKLSINALARKYGITWPEAKAKRAEVLGAGEDEEEAGDAPSFDLKTEVPAERLDDLLAAFNSTELRSAIAALEPVDKANLVQIVLQQRMDRALKPKLAVVAPIEPLQLEAGAGRDY